MDSVKVRVLPGEQFDYLDTRKELLQKFGAFVGENHGLLAEVEQETHGPDLEWDNYKEDSKTSQSAWAQIYQENDQAYYQLDWSGPAHVEELGSEVDTRNVCGDVIDQLSVGVDMTSASGEGKSLVIDRGNHGPA